MPTTTAVLQGLDQALDAPRQPGPALGHWRWAVRLQMAGIRDLLAEESAGDPDGWLVARGGSVLRERNHLLARLSELGPRVLECPHVEEVRAELKRLRTDVAHHMQRLHDLAYDEVELELGGSE